MITLLFSGCFKEDGQMRITSNIENAIIYIDGNKRGMTGDGYTTIIIEEGDHEIRIYKEKNKEWFYEGRKNVFVGANSSVKIKIDVDERPTEYRIDRLKREKREREERLVREQRERKIRLEQQNKERKEKLKKIKEKRFHERKLKKEKLKKERELELKKRPSIAKKFGFSSYPIDVYLDVDTMLMWQDNLDTKIVKKQWVTDQNYEAKNYMDTSGDTAFEYCKNMVLSGFNDWRLPRKLELRSLYKKKHLLNNLALSFYWSIDSEDSSAWIVYFNDGSSNYNLKYGKALVRCVRNTKN